MVMVQLQVGSEGGIGIKLLDCSIVDCTERSRLRKDNQETTEEECKTTKNE